LAGGLPLALLGFGDAAVHTLQLQPQVGRDHPQPRQVGRKGKRVGHMLYFMATKSARAARACD